MVPTLRMGATCQRAAGVSPAARSGSWEASNLKLGAQWDHEHWFMEFEQTIQDGKQDVVSGLSDVATSLFLKRMSLLNRRLERERKTLEAMITGYCRGVHGRRDELCAECRGLLDYATIRLQRCPFQEAKPTCVKCPIHCYQPHIREQVKAVMRYAGPRMFWRHPILAAKHFLDAYRKVPPIPR